MSSKRFLIYMIAFLVASIIGQFMVLILLDVSGVDKIVEQVRVEK